MSDRDGADDHHRVWVGLLLRGEFVPDEVSRMLRLEPSLRWAKGEVSKAGRVRKASMWRFDSDASVTADIIEPHLAWLLDHLEPQAEALVELVQCDDVEGIADVFWESPGRSGGPWVEPSTMTRLAALHLPLVISFYATDSIRDADVPG